MNIIIFCFSKMVKIFLFCFCFSKKLLSKKFSKFFKSFKLTKLKKKKKREKTIRRKKNHRFVFEKHFSIFVFCFLFLRKLFDIFDLFFSWRIKIEFEFESKQFNKQKSSNSLIEYKNNKLWFIYYLLSIISNYFLIILLLQYLSKIKL